MLSQTLPSSNSTLIILGEYEEFEDETYEYRFYPNYEIIGLLNDDIFQGIPGLNLDLRKEVYIRNNMTPVFISERTPGPNRENLYEMLENQRVNRNKEERNRYGYCFLQRSWFC